MHPDPFSSKFRTSPAHLPHFILLGIYTGHRKEAILQLQWQPNTVAGHADLDRGAIDFQGRRQTTKKRRARIQTPRRLATFLRYLRLRTRQYVLEYGTRRRPKVMRHTLADGTLREYRYALEPRGEPKPLGDIKKSFATACELAANEAHRRAGAALTHAERAAWLASAAKFRDATPHTLRHTAVSWLVQEGVPFADVGAFVGMSTEMVERVYGHLAPESNARVLAAMDRRA